MKNITQMLMLFLLGTISQPSIAQKQKPVKLLFVLTSHDQLGNTGKPTGFWIEEFATPYYYFTDRGVEITVASPRGGQAPIDPKSNEPAFQTASTRRYFSDKMVQQVLAQTKKLSDVKESEFAAVFYPGGHGPMWDLATDQRSIDLILSFYSAGKPVAFVCHGPAALVHVKDSKGVYLLQGKKVTSFCNTEEEAVQLSKIVPFSLETTLRERGAQYLKGNDWSPFVVEDGGLITGQNPQSSEKVAELLYSRVKKK